MHYTPQDAAALIVSLVLVLGLVGLAALGKQIPAEIATANGAAITWLFVRSAQVAEQHKEADGKSGTPPSPPR